MCSAARRADSKYLTNSTCCWIWTGARSASRCCSYFSLLSIYFNPNDLYDKELRYVVWASNYPHLLWVGELDPYTDYRPRDRKRNKDKKDLMIMSTRWIWLKVVLFDKKACNLANYAISNNCSDIQQRTKLYLRSCLHHGNVGKCAKIKLGKCVLSGTVNGEIRSPRSGTIVHWIGLLGYQPLYMFIIFFI